MAITNYERVGKAMELLKDGLHPFIEREFTNVHGAQALAVARRLTGDDRQLANRPFAQWDVAPLLRLMWDSWNEIFRKTLGQAERTLVSELREVRNRWAHQQPFSSDDAYRALDSAARLLAAVSAPQSDELEKMKLELLRVRFDEQARSERRKTAGLAIESQATGSLKPWREVVTPHTDVASGRYQQAEFAADLWQVHLGEGSDEYKHPVEFYRRTYLTENLKRLLANAVRRLAGQGGDPVVRLQTNFGGGKTHSMLALYHLFSGVAPGELAGVDDVLKEAEVEKMPAVKRVVLVGNKLSPGNPSVKADGTTVRTLWGELAWQLGGKKAFARIQADDERATNPGDALRELMNEYGPCLILIDEWVAYARQLHDSADLPGGSFETHFTFAQSLTESAKLAKHCLLVISLPASDTSGSPHIQAEDVEVGGERGRAALDRLSNVVSRIESSWRPASAEESFEIVRRRLFEPMIDPDQYKARDVVARTFYDFYKSQRQEFPAECAEPDYERRLRAAYPIHPEVFDRLYNDWSTLARFQRTRGVLRLMAAVIHSLWEKGDRNPLIMPANISIDEPRVQFELTRYLPDNWTPVIEKDVDGPNALPLQLDKEFHASFGKYQAFRRVARTIYLGSAPTATAANRGIEDRRIKLGCVTPGESPAIFGDALRRLGGSATYLYPDGNRYWYSTQPTVTKLAEERAEELKREPDKVAQELDKRLRADLRDKGDFSRVHALPASGADVADEMEARLVVLSIEHPYSKEAGNPAEQAAKAILETRGNSPRLFQNALAFLAVDKTRLQDLDEAVRRYLAWNSILDQKEELDLSPHQVKQAENQLKSADDAVIARIPEAYQWLLVPTQATPQSAVTWQSYRLTGKDPLAARASKKLKSDESLITAMVGTRLKMELDKIPLWRGDHVAIRQLIEDFARYIYLPRLKNPQVLLAAIRDGLSLMLWPQESFAYADRFDEEARRYVGLRAGCHVDISAENSSGLLVRPEVAKKQLQAENALPPTVYVNVTDDKEIRSTPGAATGGGATISPPDPKPAPTPKPKRFHGSVALDPTRVGRDAGRIADEVIAHLVGLLGAKVKITLEIEAEIPGGAPDHVVRAVTENSRTLKFTNQGFEME